MLQANMLTRLNIILDYSAIVFDHHKRWHVTDISSDMSPIQAQTQLIGCGR
jgi:hypothetical protein